MSEEALYSDELLSVTVTLDAGCCATITLRHWVLGIVEFKCPNSCERFALERLAKILSGLSELSGARRSPPSMPGDSAP